MSELQIKLAEESKHVSHLQHELQRLIKETDWNSFKSKDTLVPTLEVRAMLLNAAKKLSKINIEFVTAEIESDHIRVVPNENL